MGGLIDELAAGIASGAVETLADAVALLCARLGCTGRAYAKEEATGLEAPVVRGDPCAAEPSRDPGAWEAPGTSLLLAGAARVVEVPIRVGRRTCGRLELCFASEPPPGLASSLEPVAALLGLLLGFERSRERVERLAAILDHVAHPIFVKDRSFRWVLLNRAFCELVGWPREVLLLRSDYDFFPRSEADFFRRKDVEMFTTGRTVEIPEEPITDAHGRVHMLATTKVPLLGPDGEATHLVGIIHDITRLKDVEEELHRKNEELALVNRELEAFSFSVSHDLRAPLRSLDGFSRALLEEHADALGATGRDYLVRVRRNAQRMGRLIDDMLALSRVSRAELRVGRVDLGRLATEVVERLREAEPGRRVELHVAPGLEARGDARLLEVALENLLGNAWKFTSRADPARIEFGATGSGADRVFFVRDNGAGFDMASLDKLFRPFSRLHGPDEFPGTGVGLATVQRIVHRHGGRIWAEAEPGRGATFSFTLP